MTAIATPSSDASTSSPPSCPGRCTDRADPDWDEHRLAWARAVDQQPVAVVTARTAEDVVAAVRFAVLHGLSSSAQPVGHGATTAVTGTVLVRTRGLQEITVDVEPGSPGSVPASSGASCSPTPRRTASPAWPAAAATRRSSASASAAGSAGSAGPSAWRAHSIRAVEVVDATASCAGSPPTPTPTCSGRSAAVAATSASSPPSRSTSSRRRTSTAGG